MLYKKGANMLFSFKVSQDEYFRYKKHLKSFIILKGDSEAFNPQRDTVAIVPPTIQDAELFNDNTVLKYKILSMDFDETIKEIGTKGIKKGYFILNLSPLFMDTAYVENPSICTISHTA
jgi:hypothetical protein